MEHPSDDRADEAGTVAAALEALDGLEQAPVSEHLPAYEQAHAELRAALEI